MLKHKDHFHGSDLEKIEAIYHIPKEEIICFSANINPLGISSLLRDTLSAHVDAVASYPDREYTALRNAISNYCGASPSSIVVGNGSTELISLIIQAFQPKQALILGPTYSEYEREISLSGGHTRYYPLREADGFRMNTEDFCTQLQDDLDLVVLCNPNNPTSSAIDRTAMRKILDACLVHGIFVMIDETYVEFTSPEAQISSVPLTDYYTNLVVLRGTSKFFAAPGLRLGYAVTGSADLVRTLNTRQNPWTITSLSEVAGRIMFSDTKYIAKTNALIDSERERVCGILRSWPSLHVYDAHANFVLVKILAEKLTADDIFEHCIRKGLMIRNCSTFPFLDNRYFRFCFMSKEQNDLLLSALQELCLPKKV